jgi:hypothetical protein
VRPLIVLDTGVVIRALIGSTGASSYRMVRLAATGAVRLAHSDEGLRELTRVSSRRRMKKVSFAVRLKHLVLLWIFGHTVRFTILRAETGHPSMTPTMDGCLISRSTPRPITSYLGIHTLLILRCRSPSKY